MKRPQFWTNKSPLEKVADQASAPAEIAATDLETPETPAAKPAKAKKQKPPKRHVLIRLFGVGIWGWFKLIALCVLVGAFVTAANFNPAEQDINILAAVGSTVKQAMAAAGWAVRNFWQPALAGAVIVLPIWVIWRLISLPFRK